MNKAKSSLILLLFVFSSLLLQFCNYRCKGGSSNETRVIDSFNFSDPFLSKANRVFVPRDSIVMNANDTLNFEMYASTHLVYQLSHFSEGLYACDISIRFNLIDFDSMAVFTEVDFDQQHKTGTRVDEFFRVSAYNLNSNVYPINQYTKCRIGTVGDYGNFTLSLVQKPSTRSLKLKLCFYHTQLSDGISIQSPTYTFKH